MDWDAVKDRILMWFYILAGITIGLSGIMVGASILETISERSVSTANPYTIYCREVEYFFVAHSTDTPVPNGAWLSYTDVDTKATSFVSGSCAAVKD
jgi:hypothetical protein